MNLTNPVMVSSGTFDHTKYSYYKLKELGGIVTKTVTIEPREGNKEPRIVKTPSGILNSVGLENPGIHEFMKDILPLFMGLNVYVSIYGNTIDEFVYLASILNVAYNLKGIEINFSCPNINSPVFSNEKIKQIIKKIKLVTDLPIIAKLSPSYNVIEAGKSAQEAEINAISVMNTIPGMVIDVKNKKYALGNKVGGLSGPAIKPIAVKLVHELVREVNVPVIGIGGITCLEDALQFFMVGAKAIQVGSASINNPNTVFEIIEGLKNYDLNSIIL